MRKSESSEICQALALKGLTSQNSQGCQSGIFSNIDKYRFDHQNPLKIIGLQHLKNEYIWGIIKNLFYKYKFGSERVTSQNTDGCRAGTSSNIDLNRSAAKVC